MAYSKQIIEEPRALFELGKSLRQIELIMEIPFSTVRDWSKAYNWEKQKTAQLKSDIIDFEKKFVQLEDEKCTLLHSISDLEMADIKLLDKEIFNETKRKSVLFNIISLSMVRKQQILMKNTKSAIVKTKVYDNDGRVVGEEATVVEVPLTPADLKDIDDGADKNSLTLKINERHAKTETNNYNAFQPISEIKIIDA